MFKLLTVSLVCRRSTLGFGEQKGGVVFEVEIPVKEQAGGELALATLPHRPRQHAGIGELPGQLLSPAGPNGERIHVQGHHMADAVLYGPAHQMLQVEGMLACCPEGGRWALTDPHPGMAFQFAAELGGKAIGAAVDHVRYLGVSLDVVQVQVEEFPIPLADQIDHRDSQLHDVILADGSKALKTRTVR